MTPTQELQERLQALASDPKLKILRFMLEERLPPTVTEIAEGTRLKLNNVSQHLQKLRLLGMVIEVPDGLNKRYATDGVLLNTMIEEIKYLLRRPNAVPQTGVLAG